MMIAIKLDVIRIDCSRIMNARASLFLCAFFGLTSFFLAQFPIYFIHWNWLKKTDLTTTSREMVTAMRNGNQSVVLILNDAFHVMIQ